MATTNPPIYISEAPVMLIVAAVVILFSSAIIWAMVRDYRLYLQNFDQAKYSFTHFIKREQYYVCLLLCRGSRKEPMDIRLPRMSGKF